MTLLLALLSGVLGVIPLLLGRQFRLAIAMAIVYFIVSAGMVYFFLPELTGPFWGMGFWIFLLWVISAGSSIGTNERDAEQISLLVPVPPVLLAIVALGSCGINSSMMQASSYASLAKPIGESTWSQDIQPKDPRHMRMGTYENAQYVARKSIGEAGAVGSQFEMKDGLITLQMVKGELWFVAPLDFRGFSTWTSTGGSPGYIMVSAEDPTRPAHYFKLPAGQEMRYSPGAFFGDNLERLVWNKYPTKEIADIHFEVDDNNKPWWVVSLSVPTIGWWGDKVQGALLVDPVTGSSTFYAIDKVPTWVDRVLPKNIVQTNLNNWGTLSGGFINRAWSKQNVVQAEEPILVYGESGRPMWVTNITSHNDKDDSLLAVIYTDSHSGQSKQYKVNGGATDTSILTAVDNHPDVSYKRLHGVSPQLYNVYGHMASVVPLLNDNHAFSGVAIVDIANLQNIAFGATAHDAVREFQQKLQRGGSQVAVDGTRKTAVIEGRVDRFSSEVLTNKTIFYIHVGGTPHLFTGDSQASAKLPVTQIGDTVRIEYYASGQDVQPILAFENTSLVLERTDTQTEMTARSTANAEAERGRRDANTIRQNLENLSPEKLREIESQIGKQ